MLHRPWPVETVTGGESLAARGLRGNGRKANQLEVNDG